MTLIGQVCADFQVAHCQECQQSFKLIRGNPVNSPDSSGR